MTKALILCVVLVTANSRPDKSRNALPAPREAVQSETVTGCPACCCAVKVPKRATNERAMELCMASGDKDCIKMCKQWMQDRGLPLPKTKKRL